MNAVGFNDRLSSSVYGSETYLLFILNSFQCCFWYFLLFLGVIKNAAEKVRPHDDSGADEGGFRNKAVGHKPFLMVCT